MQSLLYFPLPFFPFFCLHFLYFCLSIFTFCTSSFLYFILASARTIYPLVQFIHIERWLASVLHAYRRRRPTFNIEAVWPNMFHPRSFFEDIRRICFSGSILMSCDCSITWCEYVYHQHLRALCWSGSERELHTVQLETFTRCTVPLATEPGISLIILTPMKILQRNLNSTCYDVVTFLTQ